MKVSIISHTYLATINREKIRALYALKDLDIQLIIPRFWKEREMKRAFRVEGQIKMPTIPSNKVIPFMQSVRSTHSNRKKDAKERQELLFKLGNKTF